MNRPILCIGSYAENPYHIEKIGRNVYCIEELCYCIVKNAFLLDEESFGSSLFDWIEEECSLVKLSDDSVAAAQSSPEDPCHDIAPDQGKEVFRQGIYEPDMDKFMERIQECLDAIKKEF